MFDAAQVSPACTATEVATLGRLLQLQELSLTVPCMRKDALLTHQLFDKLTSLTMLDVHVCATSELQFVSHCTRLQDFMFRCDTVEDDGLGAAEWASVGRLTGLTNLCLSTICRTAPAQDVCAALEQLKHLVCFTADDLPVAVLPGLAACTQLTQIEGDWREGEVMNIDGLVIPSVVVLRGTGGAVPFSVFPNLREVHYDSAIDASALCSLSSHCSDLRQLSLEETAFCEESIFSMAEVPPDVPYVAYWQTLADPCLHKLSSLGVSVFDDAELIAVVTVALALVKQSLTALGIIIMPDSCVTTSGLVQVARLSGLQQLHLRILSDGPDRGFLCSEHECFMLMCALWGAEHVHISSADETLLGWFDKAKAGLQGSQLPAPASITISCRAAVCSDV